MRIFFVFLLLLNLLFFFWQYTQPEKQTLAIKPLPSHMKPVVLLRELKGGQSVESGPVEVTVIEVVEPPEPVEVIEPDVQMMVEKDSCYTLGPFEDQQRVKEVQKVLEGYSKNLAVRKIQEKEQHRYWVYLGAARNRNEAIETSQELAKKRLKDYYIVRGGENNNRISLGHYREKNSAERRMSQLKLLGYEPVLEVIYRTFDLFWLDYVLESNHLLDEGVLQDFMAEGVVKLDRACE